MKAKWREGRYGTTTLSLPGGMSAGIAWAVTGDGGYIARVMGQVLPMIFASTEEAKRAVEAELRRRLTMALAALGDGGQDE